MFFACLLVRLFLCLEEGFSFVLALFSLGSGGFFLFAWLVWGFFWGGFVCLFVCFQELTCNSNFVFSNIQYQTFPSFLYFFQPVYSPITLTHNNPPVDITTLRIIDLFCSKESCSSFCSINLYNHPRYVQECSFRIWKRPELMT